MVDRVFLHIGLPKTGTTYLQKILWANRGLLASEGVTLPGQGHRRHLWAALDLQERPGLSRRHPDAKGTWERLCSCLDRTEGTGLFTHEFFSAASSEQAIRAVQRLDPAEVHVIVTARHALGLLTAGWQEQVKNGSSLTPRQVAEGAGAVEFSWRTWDLKGVLERWTAAVPADRIHVLPMPTVDEPKDQHWRNFASVLGLTADYPLPEQAVNQSLGVVQVELLRRLNPYLTSFKSAFDRGQWIRGYLAEGHLADQDSERAAMPEDLVEDCRRRSADAVDFIKASGFDVVGDLETLQVPTQPQSLRELETVTPDELLDSAGELVAALLDDVRNVSGQLEDALQEDAPVELVPRIRPVRSLAARLRSRRHS